MTNRNLLARYLLNGDVTSRIALATVTHLKQATVSNIIGDFIARGMVEETGTINNGIGRPIRGIRFCKERFWILAVRLERNFVKIGVIDLAGNFDGRWAYGIDSGVDFSIIAEDLIERLGGILEGCGGRRFLGISIAVPGPWISRSRQLAFFPGFSKWQDFDLGAAMEKKLGLRVFIDRDTNIALMAEQRHYSWTFGGQLVLLVTIGKGIGGAIYSNNGIMRGSLGIAGEIGHMSVNTAGIPCECGNRGCLERYASVPAIVGNVRRRAESAPTVLNGESTIDDIIAAYRGGDALALSCVNEAAAYIGHALASLSYVLNPGLIIVGDTMSAAGSPFLGAIRGAFDERAAPAVRESTLMSLSTVKEDPPLLGGVQVVVEGCLGMPDFWARPGGLNPRFRGVPAQGIEAEIPQAPPGGAEELERIARSRAGGAGCAQYKTI
jgi:predicted NBD/HSP70 family sugar kinase